MNFGWNSDSSSEAILYRVVMNLEHILGMTEIRVRDTHTVSGHIHRTTFINEQRSPERIPDTGGPDFNLVCDKFTRPTALLIHPSIF